MLKPEEVGFDNRSERIGWYLYDWASSPFSSSVITVFLGPYLTSLARSSAGPDGFLFVFGIHIAAPSFFPYLVSLSALTQLIALPYLSALADLYGKKKQMLLLFAYGGALSTVAMYSITESRLLLGGVLFLVANFSFGAALVFYNALLPQVARSRNRDSVSCWGWALGYLGGGIVLALHLLLLRMAPAWGISTAHAVRINLFSVGAWWAVFTAAPWLTIQSEPAARSRNLRLSAGVKRLIETLATARRYPHTLLFLLAFTIYNDGVQTMISLATQFGHEEMNIPIATLTGVILMVQFIAFFGSLLFKSVAGAYGAKHTLVVCLLTWCGVVLYAYTLMDTATQFLLMAGIIGLVMGGTQALSRSLYAGIIPKGEEAQYFSLYEVSSSATSWLGPLAFGLALQFTGSYRLALLSLIAFFGTGLVLLSRVNVAAAARAVMAPSQNAPSQ